jgi:hypothetical protein
MSHSAAARRAAPAAIAILVLTSVLPVRYSGWMKWFGDLAVVIVTPLSDPASDISRWLAPATRGPAPPEEIARLEAEVETYRALHLRLQADNDDLRARIRELQRNIELTPDVPIRPVSAEVVGDTGDLSSGLVTLRRGSRHGVVRNTVVAVRGMHLFGRVEEVSLETCRARPITDKNAGAIHTLIVLGEGLDAPQLICRLVPQDDGTLKGPVEHELAPDSTTALKAERGQTVYLNDETWPRSSRMLIVGHVRSVELDPNNAQRQIVVVSPEINLSRVNEVVLRIAEGE